MRLIWLWAILSTFVLGDTPPLLLLPTQSNTSSEGHITYIIDSNRTFTPEEIRQSTILLPLEKPNIGYSRSRFWTRMTLHNPSDKPLTQLIVHPRPGINHLELYLYEDDTLLTHHTMGNFYPNTQRAYRSILNNYEITLQPHQTLTFIAAIESYTSIELKWLFYKPASFFAHEYENLFFIGFFGGFVFLLMMLSFLLYRATRRKLFTYFIFYLLFGWLSQNFLRLAVHTIEVPMGALFVLAPIFTSLYVIFWHWIAIEIFALHKREKGWYYANRVIIISGCLFILLYGFAFFYQEMLRILPVSVYYAVGIVLPFDLIFAFVMFKKRYFAAGYFMLATLGSKSFFFYYLYTLTGGTHITFLSRFGMTIGIMLGALFIALALIAWFKSNQKEAQNLRDEIEEQKKFTIIGSAISFIAHQWRQPLSRMGASLMHLQSDIDHTPQKTISSLKKEVEELVQNVEHINQTIKDIQNLFAIHDKTAIPFMLHDSFTSVLKEVFYDHMTHINIENRIPPDLILTGNPKLFEQAMINLLQNSAQAFVEHSIQAPRLELVAHTTPTHLILEIADNAGGIAIKPIESIFELYVSSKKEGTGLGLAIVKKVIEQKFGGTISVHNEGDGVRFRLYFLIRNGVHLAS